jgi:hypothetical protein
MYKKNRKCFKKENNKEVIPENPSMPFFVLQRRRVKNMKKKNVPK